MILGYYLDKYHIIEDVIDVIDGSNNGINYIVVLVVPYHIISDFKDTEFCWLV